MSVILYYFLQTKKNKQNADDKTWFEVTVQ